MDVVIRRATPNGTTADAVVTLVPSLRAGSGHGGFDRALRSLVNPLIASGDFRGRFLECAVLYPSRGRPRRAIMIGLGPAAELTPHGLRLAAASAARKARELGCRTLAIELTRTRIAPAQAAHALSEGAVLGSHRFSRYRSDAGKRPLRRLEVLVDSSATAADVREASRRGARWAEAVCLARDLANTPGQDLVPASLAAVARDVARASGARLSILGPREMEKAGMSAVLAVGRGSVHPPRFIVLERDPGAAKAAARRRGARRTDAPTIVLVGKGITFDTGGISIKPRDGMARMKYDMAGAATVLAVFSALDSLELPFRVVGLIPSAENMPGGHAFKPGDVLRMMDGTTVEVTNTDAEGRLVLADALCYAKRFSPQAVIDLATLTGSIRVALGNLAAGLFTHDDALAGEMLAAAAATHERVWRMPMWDEYAEGLRSDIADVVNSGPGEGGSSIAALFLARFARGLRWAHLDIASTAWAFTDRPHEPRGPTGFGVRLLLEWLTARAAG